MIQAGQGGPLKDGPEFELKDHSTKRSDLFLLIDDIFSHGSLNQQLE